MGIFDSKPPKDGIYYKGFKGKGMCAHCYYSKKAQPEDFNIPNYNYNGLLCLWYSSTCKQVSRNCPGIMYLKNKI